MDRHPDTWTAEGVKGGARTGRPPRRPPSFVAAKADPQGTPLGELLRVEVGLLRFPLLAELKRAGMAARQMAAEFTARGILTPTGARWHAQTVLRVLGRAGSIRGVDGRTPLEL